MMMTYEDYKQLMELVQKRDEEAEEISKAIGGFFEICEIAKKEYIEKFDWAMKNIDTLRSKRDAICKEANQKMEAIYSKYKTEQTPQEP